MCLVLGDPFLFARTTTHFGGAPIFRQTAIISLPPSGGLDLDLNPWFSLKPPIKGFSEEGVLFWGAPVGFKWNQKDTANHCDEETHPSVRSLPHSCTLSSSPSIIPSDGGKCTTHLLGPRYRKGKGGRGETKMNHLKALSNSGLSFHSLLRLWPLRKDLAAAGALGGMQLGRKGPNPFTLTKNQVQIPKPHIQIQWMAKKTANFVLPTKMAPKVHELRK